MGCSATDDDDNTFPLQKSSYTCLNILRTLQRVQHLALKWFSSQNYTKQYKHVERVLIYG
jgi:hypothetical protein